MSAAARDPHVHRVHVGKGPAGCEADLAGRQVRFHVQGQGEVRPGEALEESVTQHGQGAAADLLGGLSHHQQRTGPVLAQRGQQPGRGDQVGGVHVVPAGVHHADAAAVLPLDADLARVVEAGGLRDGQGVHVAAEHQGGALPVAQQAHHPGAPHAAGDLEAGSPPGPSPPARRWRAPRRTSSGWALQLPVQSAELRESRVDPGRGLLPPGRLGGGGLSRQPGGQAQQQVCANGGAGAQLPSPAASRATCSRVGARQRASSQAW